MKRNQIILIVIVAVCLVIVPIPHPRTKQESSTDLVKTLDCSRTLQDGYSLSVGWTDMQDETKIVVDIQSTEEVRVVLKGVTNTLYDSTKKVHDITSSRTDASYDISVTNPSLFGTGPSVVMSGSIKAYHVYEKTVIYQEWLPWWMP